MFPARYWPARYWPTRYWVKTGAAVAQITNPVAARTRNVQPIATLTVQADPRTPAIAKNRTMTIKQS